MFRQYNETINYETMNAIKIMNIFTKPINFLVSLCKPSLLSLSLFHIPRPSLIYLLLLLMIVHF